MTMPMQRDRYPPDWEAISLDIRERESWCCLWCGVEQGQERISTKGKPYKVVLTVAHLNHDTTDNREANLAALCQVCHLRYDVRQHTRNAAATRRQKLLNAGQMEMELLKDDD